MNIPFDFKILLAALGWLFAAHKIWMIPDGILLFSPKPLGLSEKNQKICEITHFIPWCSKNFNRTCVISSLLMVSNGNSFPSSNLRTVFYGIPISTVNRIIILRTWSPFCTRQARGSCHNSNTFSCSESRSWTSMIS